MSMVFHNIRQNVWSFWSRQFTKKETHCL